MLIGEYYRSAYLFIYHVCSYFLACGNSWPVKINQVHLSVGHIGHFVHRTVEVIEIKEF